MVIASEKMAKFDCDLPSPETLRTAAPLDFAWFGYAPNEMKERYREAGNNPNMTATLRQMMEGEVSGQIGNGELVAFGVLIAPELEDTARKVPPTLFQSQRTEIDWEQGLVTGLGRTFADVRVCAPEKARLEGSAFTDPAEEVVSPNKRGGGRTNLYPQAREILERLFVEPSYKAMSAARLVEPFNKAYLERFRPPDGKLPPISERSLREHVKRYRQELAGIGEN